MSQLQLLFYSANLFQKTVRGFYQHIPSSYLVLKNYVREKERDLYQQINWHIPFFIVTPHQEILDYIKQHNINCLCMGLYIWNYEHCCELARLVKNQFGDSVSIVVGGPNCSSETDPRWGVDHPWFDYSITGDGEVPFVTVLKDIVGAKKINPITAKNIVYRSQGQIVKTQYQYIKPDGESSPYIELKEELHQLVNQVKQNPGEFDQGQAIITYETSRGCPYGCTFCDWTGGLSHKVSKRKADWHKELDAIVDAGIDTIYLGDANYGQWDSDIELTHYMGTLSKTRGLAIGAYNLSKNKKANVERIFEIMAENNLIDYFKLSVQDSNPDVLEAIQRPDITWQEHLAMKQRLEAKFPECWSEVELILGLPGQTKQSWVESITNALRDGCFPRVMGFEILPQSPAGYDQDYRKKWQITNKIVWYPNQYWFDPDTPDYSLFARPSDSVLSTSTFSLNDRSYMTVWYLFVQGILNKMDLFGFLFDLRRLDLLWPLMEKFLQIIDSEILIEQVSQSLVINLSRERPVFAISDTKQDQNRLIRPNFLIDELLIQHTEQFIKLLDSVGLLKQYTDYNLKPKKMRGVNL